MKVLEIAIGLVLIYFLYSLLASIIAEIISTWIGMRARMLKQGIENILNDIKPGSRKDFVRWLKDIFLIEDKNFQYSNGGKFYDEPTIKYLSKPGEHKWYSLRNRKPSYISNENFMITILNMLSGKGRGISEWDKIKFAIETNALHFDPETHKMFMDFVKRSDDQFKQFVNLLQNQFSDTMDRINGWYKRKIGLIIFYIGLVMAIGFNVDTIQIVKILSNDSEKRIEMVQLAEEVIDKKAGVDTLLNRKETIDELKYKLEAHGIVKDAVLKANSIVALGWEFPYDTTHIRKGKYEKLFIDIN
jgi:D-ribose pyranose/furanose isomerase RbsD